MLFEEYNLEAAIEVAREEAMAEGKMAGITEGRMAGITEGRMAGITEGRMAGITEGRMAGITEGVKGSLDILMELHLPMTTIREKLVAKYPEQREMVEELLLHETKEEYTAEKDIP